jgi:hypothetical protein
MPTFSLFLKVNDTVKQPSPSTIPVTYHGFRHSVAFSIEPHFLQGRQALEGRVTGVLPNPSIQIEPHLSNQSLRGHQVNKYSRLPSGSPFMLHNMGGFPRYEPVLHVLSRIRGAKNYPTRNFARCLNQNLVIDFDSDRMTSLMPSLHVAMQMGLYLHSNGLSVRRIVSEDSDRDRSVFPADCPHRMDCHCPYEGRVPSDTRSFQHIARFY